MSPLPPSPIKFRTDINGLRAWAVMSVLFFHFSLFGLPGGFAGVDVFFVLSGYLMTAIVLEGLQAGRFSIWQFYLSRIRRIFPALLVMLAVLLALGWFWLSTPDYQTLGVQSAYSLIFSSNINFWLESGYFDASSEEKWLLHTWSLAVEAQFYLIYPVLLMLMWRITPSFQAILKGVLFLFIASFSWNLWLQTTDLSASFFLLPSRAWELLAGGMVYLVLRLGWFSSDWQVSAHRIGWLLLAISFIWIDSTWAWPSYWALLPVVGTSLILLAQAEQSVLTAHPIAQWLGARSYSLYLWHWPLVVLLAFLGWEDHWSWVLLAFPLSIVLAHFSFEWIEVPTRRHLQLAKRYKEIMWLAVVSGGLMLFSVSVKWVDFQDRVDPQIDQVALAAGDHHPQREACHDAANPVTGSPGCEFGKTEGELAALLVGDSHAVTLVKAFDQAVTEQNQKIKLWSFSSCPLIKGLIDQGGDGCAQSTHWLLNALPVHPEQPVILMNSTKYFYQKDYWSGLSLQGQRFDNRQQKRQAIADAWVETVCEMAQDRPVYWLQPYPEMRVSVPEYLSRQRLFGLNDQPEVSLPYSEYQAQIEFVSEVQNKASDICGVRLVSTEAYFCDQQTCLGAERGRPLYYDADHISTYGSQRLVPLFRNLLQSF